jgi:hypothetical protein
VPRARKICPWCGCGRAQYYVRDAAGVVHWFHAQCKREHAAWVKAAAVSVIVALAACGSPEAIDPAGRYVLTATYDTGTCNEPGTTAPVRFDVTESGKGHVFTVEPDPDVVSHSVTGLVVCDEACVIDYSEDAMFVDAYSYSLVAWLTLTDEDAVIGSGTFTAAGTGVNCSSEIALRGVRMPW